MSIAAIREAFQAAAMPVDPAQARNGLRCTAARLRYVDKDGGDSGRDHQVLEFDVVRASDNTQKTIISDPIKGGDSLHVAAVLLAQKHLAES